MEIKRDHILTGSFCALGCEILYGLSYIFTKQVTAEVSALSLLGWRFLLAFIVMSILAGTGFIKIRLKGRSVKPLLWIALFSPRIYFIGETFGISHTTAQKAELFLRVFRLHQICTKGVPENMNPFASLIITYLVGAAVAFIMFLILGDSRDILTELKKANWTSFVLGIVLVGLEVGFIYAYKAGWKVSAAQIVTSSILGVILIIVGYVGYKEAITWNKIVGVIVCLAGLGLINLK